MLLLMASLCNVFNNVMIQLNECECNKGETWNGDINYKNITPSVASFSELLLSFGNKLVNENKPKCTVRKSQPKLNYNFMDDLSEDLKEKILTNMTKLVSIINEEKDNINLIDILARFIMRERAISSGTRASEGKGHRIISYYMMVLFIDAFPKYKNIIELVAHYGCFQDYNALIAYYYSTNINNKDMINYISGLYAKAINDDIEKIVGKYNNHNELYTKIKKLYGEISNNTSLDEIKKKYGMLKISMAGKWFPRPSSEFGSKRQNARQKHDLEPNGIHEKRYTKHRNMLISKVFFPNEDIYYYENLDKKKQNFYDMNMRYILTSINILLNVIEYRMSNNQWDMIEPSSIPAGALHLYRKALLNEIVNSTGDRTTDENRIALRHKLIKASLDNTLKGATLDSVKFANTIWGGSHVKSFSKSERLVIHSQFLALVEDIRERVTADCNDLVDPLNVIATIDVSGSMASANVMGPAIILGIIITLISKLGRCFLTFDNNPTIIHLKEDGDIIDWVTQVSEAPWGGSTNMDGALERLLDIMKKVRQQKPDFDGKINHVILTDGQFNPQFCKFGGINWDTFAERMIFKFKDNGFNLPRTTFWNLNHRSPGFPATSQMNGMILAEGLSQGLMLSVLGNAVTYKTDDDNQDVPNINPLESFLKSIYRSDFDLVSSTLF
jgi:hypothetical protein